MTQILTGHGKFISYLHRFKLYDTEDCLYCDNADTVEHTFFHCVRWDETRKIMEERIGRVTPENVVNKMMEKKENWEVVKRTATIILRTKEQEMKRGNEQGG